MRRRFRLLAPLAAALASLLGVTLPEPARAQPATSPSWPNGRVVLVVPYPPGATSDLLGRLVAARIAADIGQVVVVENRPGVSGMLGSRLVADAAPDGNTLLQCNNGSHVIQPLLGTTVRYDPVADFTPIGVIGSADVFLGISGDLPATTLAEFIALARSRPGAFSYGSAGVGSFGHFAGELLNLTAGIDLVHIPYRGSAAAVNDLVAGRIQAMLDPAVLSQRDTGRVRVLAVSGPTRFPTLPDVPTATEAGLPGFVLEGWFALCGPPRLPAPIVARLSGILAAAERDPAFRDALLQLGLTPQTASPEALAERMRADLALFRSIKQRAGIEASP